MKRIVIVAQCLAFALLAAISCQLLHAQDSDVEYRSPARPTRPLTGSEYRAEKEAESMVSLPAEQIISLLQKEPGLFLEIKKMLVRRAFEQGRILDRSELRDDILFRLIREDEHTRILITQEIVERGYIQVRPRREDSQREQQELAALENRKAQQPEMTDEAGASQYPPPQPSVQAPAPPAPAAPPSSQPPNNDMQRTLLKAEASPGDIPGALGAGLSSVDPGQLAQLVKDNPGTAAALMSGAGSEYGLDPADIRSALDQFKSSASSPAPAAPTPNAASAPAPRPPQRPVASVNYRPAWRSPQLRPALEREPNPYADVPSLYDLYAQYASQSPTLVRFGSQVFHTGTGNSDELPMDLPVGPDYVIGVGDGLSIDLWGSVSQKLQTVVDSQGRITLPEVGTLQVAGHTLGEVQRMVQSVLRTQFRDLDADVSLSRIHTIRIYVVGDVQRPGAYDVSSLSTALNALYQAGGPTNNGSLRIVRHFRGKTLVENIDLYDLLLHGVNAGTERLQTGDTLLVPPVGPEVTIQGMVRRPGIYELNGEKDLAQVLELAGGVLPSGTLRHVDVERVVAHQSRTMLRLDIPDTEHEQSVAQRLVEFDIQDGDVIKISPILPFTEKAVYLEGHVFRPGQYAYRAGMKVTDLIKSYQDLLPEPYGSHAEIIRLKPPDNAPEVLAFNLDGALQGKGNDPVLKPFDTVRIFGRFDFDEPPVVTVEGEVRDPGDHLTNGATYLRDAIYLAGNTTPDADLNNAQIFRRTGHGKLEVLSVNLRDALAGDPRDNILLQPSDRVFIHENVMRAEPPTVAIQGEVARPGRYPLGNDMMASDLVRLAGGFKRSAYTKEADLTRFSIEHGTRVASEHESIAIDRAMAGDPDTDVRLHDGDVLTISQLSGWNDIGATISVQGEVIHPGTFGIQPGERLSDALARAGGFTGDAYPYGAVLLREQVREIEEKHRTELIDAVQQEGSELKTAPEALGQWQMTLTNLQNAVPNGRLVIHISEETKKWVHTVADIPVRAGDVLFVPKRPNFVMVQGSVYQPTAVGYKPNRSAEWYLRQAGGPTTSADKKNIFVVRADGSVAGGRRGWFGGGALDDLLRPGDMVIVPEKPAGGGAKWKQMLQLVQLMSSVGAPLAVARGW